MTSLSLWLLALAAFWLLVYAVDFNGVDNPLLLDYRLHRDLYSFLAGSVLGAVGCVLQVVLRNPLVDHYVLGIGSSAVFSAYLAIALANAVSLPLVFASAALGGLGGLLLTISLAVHFGGSDLAYVLAGLGIASAFSGAGFVLSYYVVQRFPYAHAMLLGSFATPLKEYAAPLVALEVLMLAIYVLFSRSLNAVMVGEDFAMQLGVNAKRLRAGLVLVSGAAAGLVVGMFGTIGFLGLVAPNAARMLHRTSDNRVVMAASMLMSGILLSSSDLISRRVLVSAVGEVPAGSLVSALGGAFFLFLLAQSMRGRPR